MSVEPPEPPPGTISCPRCGAAVGPEQDWCLDCGAAARTRLAPTPNWRLPIAGLALVVVIAGAVLAIAFLRISDRRDTPAQTITTPAPAAAVPPATPATPAPAPAAPATTAAPPVPTPTQTAPGG